MSVVRLDGHPAERWNAAAQPTLRATYGEQATIELGVRYPDQRGGSIWRIEMTPTRIEAAAL
jgi:hypothetical protein